MKCILVEQIAAFGKAILEEINKRGFGSLTKNDYEVLIFHLLKENNAIPNNNFEISLDLQIPESKVKRLSYEVELKYGRHKNQITAQEFMDKVCENCVAVDENYVRFAVESQFIRNSILAKLKSINHYGDLMLNSEVVSIKRDASAAFMSDSRTPRDFADYYKSWKNKKRKSDCKQAFNKLLEIMDRVASVIKP